MFSKISSITFGLLAFAVTSSLADHWITVVNNCGSTVNPTVVDTSCTYSASRCGQTSTYGGPWSQTIGAGGSAIFKLPNNFVGRIFDSYSGGCGSDGWDCSLLEYNFDNGDSATDQSYDLSNIQGFTRGQMAVPYPSNTGCLTKTCFTSGCDASQAYPVGDEGDNAANTSCGSADLGIALYYCAA
ncbi:uncharacterized protein STEHIDRAFT_123434 [Stereum hirsutum FP-91666 SS1]|uniref:uncharacterized protein n=1 Tax=Stereum hirsutum (strain FP-91666) TaxID=721885 RepID=UPI000444A860|nr:uncharacterized protein STEHIDRAFT_123434 [Stereum hirsutum FP-91666 SS1]EIM83857.1 hypothetical protein STEHIDRAFT_123434 [Stereum hirsutum FP-91666 SS1]